MPGKRTQNNGSSLTHLTRVQLSGVPTSPVQSMPLLTQAEEACSGSGTELSRNVLRLLMNNSLTPNLQAAKECADCRPPSLIQTTAKPREQQTRALVQGMEPRRLSTSSRHAPQSAIPLNFNKPVEACISSASEKTHAVSIQFQPPPFFCLLMWILPATPPPFQHWLKKLPDPPDWTWNLSPTLSLSLPHDRAIAGQPIPPPPPAYLLSNEIKLAFGMPLSTAFPLQWKQDKNSKNSRYMLENKATKWGMLDFWLLGLWRGIRVRNSGVLPGLRWKEILHWVNATCCWKQAHHLGKAWQVSNTENCK